MSTLPPLEERELELARPMTACAPDERFIEGQLVRQRKIKTYFVHPPISIRSCDWAATFDDYDGACVSRHLHPMGHGETEAAAVADLLAQVEDE